LPSRRAFILLGLFSLFCLAVQAFTDPERYRSVRVDDDGRLHILLESGQEIAPPTEKEQTSFSDPAISPDGRTAGWIVE